MTTTETQWRRLTKCGWLLLVGVCSGCFGPAGEPCADGESCSSAEDEGGPVFEQEPEDQSRFAGGSAGGRASGGSIFDGFDAGPDPLPDPGTCEADAGDCTSEPFEGFMLANVSGARALQLSTEHVYVLEWGSEDDDGNHQGDGRIVRVPHTGGEAVPRMPPPATATPVVTELVKPLDMLLDPELVLWTERHGDFVQIWAADRDDGSDRRMLAEGLNLSWAHDLTHVYYMTEENGNHGDPVELFRVEKASGAIEPLSDADFDSSFPLAVGAADVYVFGDLGFFAVPLAGGDAVRIADGPVTDLAFAVYDDQLFYGTLSGMLRTLHIDGSSDSVLAQFEESSTVLRALPYAGAVHVSRATADGSRVIERMFYSPPEAAMGSLERLVTLPGSTSTVASHDLVFGVDQDDLYWVADGVLRHDWPARPIEGFDPVEGALGGPCHPDLSCADGALRCFAGVCQ